MEIISSPEYYLTPAPSVHVIGEALPIGRHLIILNNTGSGWPCDLMDANDPVQSLRLFLKVAKSLLILQLVFCNNETVTRLQHKSSLCFPDLLLPAREN